MTTLLNVNSSRSPTSTPHMQSASQAVAAGTVPGVNSAVMFHQDFKRVRPKPAARLTDSPVGVSRFQERFDMAIAEHPPSWSKAQCDRWAEATRAYKAAPKGSKPESRSCVRRVISLFGALCTKKVSKPAPPPLTDIKRKPLPPLPSPFNGQCKRNELVMPQRPQAARVREGRDNRPIPSLPYQLPFLEVARRARHADLTHVPGGLADDYFAFHEKPQHSSQVNEYKDSNVPEGIPDVRQLSTSFYFDTFGDNDIRYCPPRLTLAKPTHGCKVRCDSAFESDIKTYREGRRSSRPHPKSADRPTDGRYQARRLGIQQKRAENFVTEDWSESSHREVLTEVPGISEWGPENRHQVFRMRRWEKFKFEEPEMEDDCVAGESELPTAESLREHFDRLNKENPHAASANMFLGWYLLRTGRTF